MHFLVKAAARFGIDTPDVKPELLQFLHAHDWPGNVRELAHMAERHALGLLEINAWQTPIEHDEKATLPQQMESYEAELIRRALQDNKGNAKAAIEALGIPARHFTTNFSGTGSCAAILREYRHYVRHWQTGIVNGITDRLHHRRSILYRHTHMEQQITHCR